MILTVPRWRSEEFGGERAGVLWLRAEQPRASKPGAVRRAPSMARHIYIIVAALALAVAMVFLAAYILQPIPVH
jgi:hypothetical protein